MAVARKESSIDVVEAAKRRIVNICSNGLPVYMSFSGGKDSLCLADLTYKLIQEGRINPAQIEAVFIDEEAIFPCIEETVKAWRKKLMLAGVKFTWFALEVRHFNCFNQLSSDESFICWDRYKKNVWVRRPPSFAVRQHPLLKPRIDKYQDFTARIFAGGINMTGVRVSESVQRLDNFALAAAAKTKIPAGNMMKPIYDWKDTDVWKYLYENHVDIPDIYLYLWQSGTSRRMLRVSQFFSVDTARSLVKMNEYYPDLMDRIIQREPNAYLAALYWDSEMFGRKTATRKKLEEKTEVDYKKKLIDVFNHADKIFTTPHSRNICERYRNMFLKCYMNTTNDGFRLMYEALMAGDPKLRSLRAIQKKIFMTYLKSAKAERSDKRA